MWLLSLVLLYFCFLAVGADDDSTTDALMHHAKKINNEVHSI